MISSIGKRLSDWSERYVPSPFVLALVLSVLTFVLGLAFGKTVAGEPLPTRMSQLAGGWFDGFYGSGGMKFALQMCIVLITGHALAKSAPVRRGIRALAGVASTPGAAAFVVAIVACAASLVQWGLGAIVGAFMAREMGRAFDESGRAVHYPLLGAAGYAGFLVWHGGFSGSAPLKVAEEGHFVADIIGVVPISQTLLSPLNLVVVALLVAVIPTLFWALMPGDESEMSLPAFEEPTEQEGADGDWHASVRIGALIVVLPAAQIGVATVASAGTAVVVSVLLYLGAFAWMTAYDVAGDESGEDRRDASLWIDVTEGTRALNLLVGFALVAYLTFYFSERGVGGWNLDSINLLFLTLGIALYPTPGSYVDAIVEGVRGAAGIILQFPFYFGILGVLKASGLVEQIATFFVEMSSPTTFPIFAFLSAGIVNFFVPSGGGQWAVQGDVLMTAADSLGVPVSKAIMAFSWGDAWTNMLQPFWALPLLGIMDLEARDIIGYTALVMAVTGPIVVGVMVVL